METKLNRFFLENTKKDKPPKAGIAPAFGGTG